MKVHDIVRWRCPNFPHVVHLWQVQGVYIGGMGQESLIEMKSLTHSPGWTDEGVRHTTVVVPEVLVRHLVIGGVSA